MNKIKLILSFSFLGVALLRGEGTSNYVPESRTISETFTTKVLKVYTFQEGEFDYVAYVVNWKDHEIVVSPLSGLSSEAKLKEGDTIRCSVVQSHSRLGDKDKARMSFYVASNLNSADGIERLAEVTAEVNRRRELREASRASVVGSNSAEVKKIVIQIKADGSVLLDHQVMGDDALNQKLSELVKQDKDCAVLVVADEKAAWEPINKVMNQCRKLGIGKFSMATGNAEQNRL